MQASVFCRGRPLTIGACLHQSVRCMAISSSSARCMATSSSSAPVKIGFIGAGGINFGTPEGPWNHSARLEQLPNAVFSAVVDPNLDLANKRIKDLQQGQHGHKWQDTKAFKTYQEMLQSEQGKPTVAFIGVPPQFHGGLSDKNNIELKLAQAGVHLFVEKPLSIQSAEEVAKLADELKQVQDQQKLIIAVGYMFRYSALARTAKRILEKYNAQPLGVNARYACAYSTIEKRDWWDMDRSGGPIVEQATHFVDLMRFFCGEIEQDSVQAVAVGPQAKLSDMPAPPAAEAEVPMNKRINRVTGAIWRFKSGAVGSLFHSLVLHGATYDTELEVLADGLRMVLRDPYGKPQLLVRHPHEEEYREEPLADDDMYLLEARAFIDAVQQGDGSGVAFLFSDAAMSYQIARPGRPAMKMQTAEPAKQGQDSSKPGLDTHQRQNSVASGRNEEVELPNTSEPQDAEAKAQQPLKLTVQLPPEAAEDLNATILKFAQERGIRVDTAISPSNPAE